MKMYVIFNFDLNTDSGNWYNYVIFQYGSTALILASKDGHIKVCNLLLSRDADVNIKDKVCNISFTH